MQDTNSQNSKIPNRSKNKFYIHCRTKKRQQTLYSERQKKKTKKKEMAISEIKRQNTNYKTYLSINFWRLHMIWRGFSVNYIVHL
jgi:hypothetical protein